MAVQAGTKGPFANRSGSALTERTRTGHKFSSTWPTWLSVSGHIRSSQRGNQSLRG
jgi:hypothetical protein